MMTLREALDLVPDFRSSQGRRHSLGAILALATCATQLIRHSAMGAGPRGCYGAAFGVQPGEDTLRGHPPPGVRLDVAAFEAEVGNWLANSGVEADDPLSLDGKTLRGVHGQEIPGVHLVSAYLAALGQCWRR